MAASVADPLFLTGGFSADRAELAIRKLEKSAIAHEARARLLAAPLRCVHPSQTPEHAIRAPEMLSSWPARHEAEGLCPAHASGLAAVPGGAGAEQKRLRAAGRSW